MLVFLKEEGENELPLACDLKVALLYQQHMKIPLPPQSLSSLGVIKSKLFFF